MSDRGMKKWMAFKSLPELEKEIDKIKLEKLKIDKPELSEDQMAEINEVLTSIDQTKLYSIKYYEKGFIKQIEGNIKIDLYSNLLYVDKSKIRLIDLLDIKLVN